MNIDVSSHKEDENAEDNNEVEETRVTTSAPVGISSGRLIRDAAGKVIGFETPDDDAAAGSSISIPGPSNTKVSSSDSGKKRKASAVSEELEKDETTPWGAPMAEDRVVAPVTAKTAVVQGEFSVYCDLFFCYKIGAARLLSTVILALLFPSLSSGVSSTDRLGYIACRLVFVSRTGETRGVWREEEADSVDASG